ncbi:hypothetical protein ACA910_022243 [Epithemia clementina (nom. ined.)]
MTPFAFSTYLQENRDDWQKPNVESDLQSSLPPLVVTPVSQLQADVQALAELTSSVAPPKVLVRPQSAAVAAVMFGDASGSGFGTSLWLQGSTEIHAVHGVWTRAYGSRSSNFRELYNLVASLEELVSESVIPPGTEVLMFTDNSTSEAAFYKGTSKSKLLFDLVIRLRKLEMGGNISVHVVWVAGSRMIDQGTDGLSRGDLMNGVLAGGTCSTTFLCISRFTEPMKGLFDPVHLDPDGWYERAFEPGNYVWTSPPAAALEALEQMCESKHIRLSSAHVFVCAALMSNHWRKKLGRIA